MPNPVFAGAVLLAGATGPAVLANKRGCGPIAEDAYFGPETHAAVELFQARFTDTSGTPLKIDGIVGPMTWAALFGAGTVASATKAPTPFLKKVLEIAAEEIGTKEKPLGSNRGPRVDQYLKSVGLDPKGGSYPWCAAFIYFCFQQAASALHVPNPAIKHAGVLDLWTRAGTQGTRRILTAEANASPSLVQPGCLFIITTTAGHGHTGLIEKIDGVRLTTIEGNTNETGSHEGIGVFRRKGRTIATITPGFIQY
jgi:hypothetical protein